eukprot:Skav219548  [mRNA]  locus=scaffold1863:116799:117900:+ [translate_table: standard]
MPVHPDDPAPHGSFVSSMKTPLLMAVAHGHADIVSLLLEADADANRSSADGDVPLHVAMRRGRGTIARMLLNAQADVNQTDHSGSEPLCFGATSDDVDLLRMLVQKKANVNMCNPCGSSAFTIAAAHGWLASTAFFLLECRIDVDCVDNEDADGRTSLMRAILGTGGPDRLAIVKVLIEFRADIDKMDTDGETSLSMAVEREFWNIKSLLIEAGAKLRHSMR